MLISRLKLKVYLTIIISPVLCGGPEFDFPLCIILALISIVRDTLHVVDIAFTSKVKLTHPI